MVHKFRLEILLTLAVVLLIGQLAWPSVLLWWNRPRPGTIGVDRLGSSVEGIADDFLVYLPPKYKRGTCPLVVYLHGSGERGDDPNLLRNCGPFKALRDGIGVSAVVAGPQCRPGGSWEPVSIIRFVDAVASNYDVDRKQIYLIGYSMGGYGTWRTASVHPELFTAIVPISGGGDPSEAKALASMPVWAFHGAKDETVPVSQSEQMIEVIREAGGHPKLTVMPDAGHGICEDVCRQENLWNWLLANKRSAQSQH